MKTIKYLFMVALFIAFAALVQAAPYGSESNGWHVDKDAPCGSESSVWPADKDGTQRLTYTINQDGDIMELVYREEEGIIVARGSFLSKRGEREVHAVYDLSNGNLVYALQKNSFKVQGKRWLPTIYMMQSDFDIQVFAADKNLNTEIKALLAQNKQSGCHDEMSKLFQGRDYDKEKCGEVISSLNKVMAQFVRPETAIFKEITANMQIRKFIEKVRAEREKNLLTEIFTDSRDPDGKVKGYCVGIQKMDLKIITTLRNPETQKTLAVKKKMPDYLY